MLRRRRVIENPSRSVFGDLAVHVKNFIIAAQRDKRVHGKWRGNDVVREKERQEGRKQERGSRGRMYLACSVPMGRWIFWVDSCQLRAMSTEDYSLSHCILRAAACVFFSLSHFYFPFLFLQSLRWYSAAESSNFLTNAQYSRIFRFAISIWWFSAAFDNRVSVNDS